MHKRFDALGLHKESTKSANPKKYPTTDRKIPLKLGLRTDVRGVNHDTFSFRKLSKTSPISMFIATFLEMPEMLSTAKATRES